nr:probable histone-arginine methyltransferase 1.3 [Ipomoea batatas]
MEIQAGEKKEGQEFTVASISELSSSSSSSADSAPVSGSPRVLARFGLDSGVAELRFGGESEQDKWIVFDLRTSQLFRLSPVQLLCVSEASETNKETCSRGVTIQFTKEKESSAFYCAFEHWRKQGVAQGAHLQNGALQTSNSKFDDKIEASSAKMYFHYYGQLLHQQNMLQDYVRTGTYYAAVIENRSDFNGRVVVDVGAGSGILSLFAAQVASL